jgi:hypothetical protein
VTARAEGSREGRPGRSFEIIAVLLLGVATLGSAWCGYQAAEWNGREADEARRATDQLVEASRQFGLATQTLAYDSMVVAQYAQAGASGDERLQAFYRDVLVRPGFEPTLAQWEAQLSAGERPQGLLEDDDYRKELLSGYDGLAAGAASSSEEGVRAGEIADEFILMTVLFASALFLAGVTTSLSMRTARALLVLAAGVVIAYAATRLADLPVA